MAGKSFISKDKFGKLVDEKKEQEKTVKWKDLDQEIIYKIILIEEKVSKYGDCYLTTIEDKEGNQVRIFAPAGMIKKIRKEHKEKQTIYFMCLGVEVNRLDKTTRNRYDIIFEDDSNAIRDIFINKDE